MSDSDQPGSRSNRSDVADLSRLLDRYAAPLVLYARQICADPEDAVQQAFVKLSQCDTLPTDERAWLYRVVRNEAIQQKRSDDRRRQREQTAAETQRRWFTPDPGNRIDAQQAVAALAQLEHRQREIVAARIWGGLSFREIADLVGVSQSAVHRDYQTAIQILQNELTEPCPDRSPTLNTRPIR